MSDDHVEIPVELASALREAMAHRRHWDEVIGRLRDAIETLLAEAEYATVAGTPVARWQPVTSRRLDLERLRERVDPALLSTCYIERTTRRFTLLDEVSDDD